MLVLSRKLGQKIYIGEDICIKIVDIGNGKVRIGIEAPKEVSVVRDEILPLSITMDQPPLIIQEN